MMLLMRQRLYRPDISFDSTLQNFSSKFLIWSCQIVAGMAQTAAADRAGMLPVMIPDIIKPGKEIEAMLFKRFILNAYFGRCFWHICYELKRN